ncbi:MAG: fibronectin type III domain-containing protein [Verrucomicrobia subdivision 3 bacterium]|nr:fibronectin type III domain-containing protein [Limisphaerales bacterium]
MNRTWHDFARGRYKALMKRTTITALLGILLAAAPDSTWAHDRKGAAQPRRTVPFSQAQVRIEVNATDGDSGFHVFLDAEGWKFVNIFDPNWELIFEVEGGGSIRKTGLTELFFESAEPGFDELPLDEFLARFPAGEYWFYGETLEGKVLFSKAILTHALPDAPVLLSPPEDSVQDPNNTVVAWEPVANPPGSRIVRYEVIVEDESFTPKRVLSASLPPTVTSMTIPSAFLLPGGEYKYEVLAIEAGGNQTLSEAAFRTAR